MGILFDTFIRDLLVCDRARQVIELEVDAVSDPWCIIMDVVIKSNSTHLIINIRFVFLLENHWLTFRKIHCVEQHGRYL